MFNNIPVNGWPQLKDLDKVQPILNELDKIESWKKTVKEMTFTGSELTITNALKLPARSLVLDVKPIQDLHGYDYPWAGGAGKNKLDFIAALDFWGATYTDDGAGNYTVTNEGSGYSNPYTFAASPVIVSLSLESITSRTEGSNWRLEIYDETNSVWITLNESTLSAENVLSNKIRINYALKGSGAIYSKPQIELGSIATSYTPYSNICPISGRTEVRVDTENEDGTESAYAVIQLGTTVYGADINWDTGVMTVKTTKVDMGDLQWGYNSSVNRFYATVADGKYTGSDVGMTGRCSCYAPVAVNWRNLNSGEITFGTSFISSSTSTIVVNDTAYTDATAFKTAVTGQDIEYELATPTTLQLTPAQLELLKGYNKVTTTDGAATITLKALTGANWS